MRSGGSLLLVAGLCSLTTGMPVIGSGPIPPRGPNTDFDLWPPQSTNVDKSKPVAVKVTLATQSGWGKIVGLPTGYPPPSNPTPIGKISGGRSAVFEGLFELVRLQAMTACGGDTEDYFECRGPTDGSVGDAVVAEGSTTLLPDGGDFGVYASFGGTTAPTLVGVPRARLLLARCATGRLTIGWGGTSRLVVDAGDWGLCSQSAVMRYGLIGTGGAAAEFKILAPLPAAACEPSTPVTFTLYGANADTDTCALDGQLDLEITLENKGASSVTVSYRMVGGSLQTLPLVPYDPANPALPSPLSGPLDLLEITHSNDANGAPVNRVDLTVVAHP